MEKDIEIQRECLFSHENFSTFDAFKVIDAQGKGYITAEDLDNVAQQFSLDFISADAIVNIFDRDGDGQLNYSEFAKSITPKNSNYLSYPQRSFIKPPYDVKIYQKECFDEIGHIYATAIRAENILADIRQHLQIDAEELFKQIDEFRFGYISTNTLTRYLKQNCAYKINEAENQLILSRYDKDGDYKISLDEFLREVQHFQTEEEEEPNENEESGDNQREGEQVE